MLLGIPTVCGRSPVLAGNTQEHDVQRNVVDNAQTSKRPRVNDSTGGEAAHRFCPCCAHLTSRFGASGWLAQLDDFTKDDTFSGWEIIRHNLSIAGQGSEPLAMLCRRVDDMVYGHADRLLGSPHCVVWLFARRGSFFWAWLLLQSTRPSFQPR